MHLQVFFGLLLGAIATSLQVRCFIYTVYVMNLWLFVQCSHA